VPRGQAGERTATRGLQEMAMQLVEFDDAQGHKVWVNPARVSTIKPHTGNAELTDIHLEVNQIVRAAGRVTEVAQKLNQALRA
jgi:hypothetical protein